MNYHNITFCDMLNGPGLRTVLWVAGCEHHCKGCQNPQTWDVASGIPFDESAEKEIFDSLDDEYIRGITFSGGDPMHPCNYREVLALADSVHARFPDKDIVLYTGSLWEEIKDINGIALLDYVVDGEYDESQRDTDGTLYWRGSYNQRIIDVKESLRAGKAVTCADFPARKER